MKKTEVKDYSEIPEHILDFLYCMRLYDHREWSREDYLPLFKFIVVDCTVYCTGDDYVQQNVQEYLKYDPSDWHALRLPYAIIKDGYLLKNRYGYTS